MCRTRSLIGSCSTHRILARGYARRLNEPTSLLAARSSDADQHQRQRRPPTVCSASGQNVHAEHYVRDTGQLSIEEAVHSLTGRSASFLGLSDRGQSRQARSATLRCSLSTRSSCARDASTRCAVRVGRFKRPPALRDPVVAALRQADRQLHRRPPGRWVHRSRSEPGTPLL